MVPEEYPEDSPAEDGWPSDLEFRFIPYDELTDMQLTSAIRNIENNSAWRRDYLPYLLVEQERRECLAAVRDEEGEGAVWPEEMDPTLPDRSERKTLRHFPQWAPRRYQTFERQSERLVRDRGVEEADREVLFPDIELRVLSMADAVLRALLYNRQRMSVTFGERPRGRVFRFVTGPSNEEEITATLKLFADKLEGPPPKPKPPWQGHANESSRKRRKRNRR